MMPFGEEAAAIGRFAADGALVLCVLVLCFIAVAFLLSLLIRVSVRLTVKSNEPDNTVSGKLAYSFKFLSKNIFSDSFDIAPQKSGKDGRHEKASSEREDNGAAAETEEKRIVEKSANERKPTDAYKTTAGKSATDENKTAPDEKQTADEKKTDVPRRWTDRIGFYADDEEAFIYDTIEALDKSRRPVKRLAGAFLRAVSVEKIFLLAEYGGADPFRTAMLIGPFHTLKGTVLSHLSEKSRTHRKKRVRKNAAHLFDQIASDVSFIPHTDGKYFRIHADFSCSVRPAALYIPVLRFLADKNVRLIVADYLLVYFIDLDVSGRDENAS